MTRLIFVRLQFKVIYLSGCQIRNIMLKVMTGDILEQNTDGIVNSVNEDFKFFGNALFYLIHLCNINFCNLYGFKNWHLQMKNCVIFSSPVKLR